MTKLVFTQEQQLDFTKRLQLLLLDSMVSSGHWGTAKFQGGTCLSLCYGSSRFSEDLDFLLGTDKGLKRMLTAASARMTNVLRLSVPDAKLKFAARDDDPESPSARNPRTFTLTASSEDWYRSIKIKVEFWVADPAAVAQYASGVVSAKVLTRAVEGVPLRMALPAVMVPTADLKEILVDKLHALACRDYLKHRDVFDLWWLSQQDVGDWRGELATRYPYHALMYNDSPEISKLRDVLREKTLVIAAMVGRPEFPIELKKWLGEDSSLAGQAGADSIAGHVVEMLKLLFADEVATPPAASTRAARTRRSTP